LMMDAVVPLAEDPPDAKDPAAQPKHTLSADKVRWVLLALVRFANTDGEAWPSTRTLARQTRLTSNWDVPRALAALVAAGLIKDTGRRVKRAVVWLVLAPREDENTPSQPPLVPGPVRAMVDESMPGPVRASIGQDARSDARSDARTNVQDVRLSHGVVHGPVRAEVEEGSRKKEGGALTRAQPSPESQPLQLPPLYCPEHLPDGPTEYCPRCFGAGKDRDRWLAEHQDALCRRDCGRLAVPGSPYRYCARCEQLHKGGQ
jgi:hypothetical protein